jgi:hypothetical protein
VPLASVPEYDEHESFEMEPFVVFVANPYVVPVYGHRNNHTHIPILPVPLASIVDDVADDITMPAYLSKYHRNRLSTYGAQWHFRYGRNCKATCAGSRTQLDVQGPVGALWNCDSDDLVCPQDNDTSELEGILEALSASDHKHPSCPAADPCMVVPPPCYYVSTECIPQSVIEYTLNNTSTREAEEGVDERYLHVPLAVDDLTQVKLVSQRPPLGNRMRWPYSRGIAMTPITGRDGNDYYHTCTYGATLSGWSGSVAYGFALADAEGNHVYDSGHIFGHEMWQRYYGETASPAFTSDCTDVQAGQWRNRVQYHTPNLASQNFVFGTCAGQCSAILGSVPEDQIVAPIGLSKGHLRDRLIDANDAGLGAAEKNVITAHELVRRAAAATVALGVKELGVKDVGVKDEHHEKARGDAVDDVQGKHASLGDVRDFERPFGSFVAFAAPFAFVCVIVLAVFKSRSILDFARERRERRTPEGRAERANLVV